MLVCILNALAMVRLRRSCGSYLSCNLSNCLIVDTLYEYDVGLGNLKGNSIAILEGYGVAVSEVKSKGLAALGCSVTYSYDLKLIYIKTSLFVGKMAYYRHFFNFIIKIAVISKIDDKLVAKED